MLLEQIIAENFPDLGKERGIDPKGTENSLQTKLESIFCTTYHSETGKIHG